MENKRCDFQYGGILWHIAKKGKMMENYILEIGDVSLFLESRDGEERDAEDRRLASYQERLEGKDNE